MSPTGRSTAIGKLLLLLAFGGVCGYFYHRDAAARRSEVVAVTPLERTGPDAFPLPVAPDWPLWGDVGLFVILLLLFFGVYELLGLSLGWLISRMRR